MSCLDNIRSSWLHWAGHMGTCKGAALLVFLRSHRLESLLDIPIKLGASLVLAVEVRSLFRDFHVSNFRSHSAAKSFDGPIQCCSLEFSHLSSLEWRGLLFYCSLSWLSGSCSWTSVFDELIKDAVGGVVHRSSLSPFPSRGCILSTGVGLRHPVIGLQVFVSTISTCRACLFLGGITKGKGCCFMSLWIPAPGCTVNYRRMLFLPNIFRFVFIQCWR